jgi:hypothetical protein
MSTPEQLEASERQWRLFECACCRSIWHLLIDERSRHAVEVAERYADGMASDEELAAAREAAIAVHTGSAEVQRRVKELEVLHQQPNPDRRPPALDPFALARHSALAFDPAVAAAGTISTKGGNASAADSAVAWVNASQPEEIKKKQAKELDEQYGRLLELKDDDEFRRESELLRADTPAGQAELRKQGLFFSDIVRASVPTLTTPWQTIPPAVLNWNDRTIPRLAAAIYEARRLPEGTLDNAQLAILADALLAAGCDDEALIQHCRSEGPHVRGCWAVDLLLGKR